MNGSDAGLQFRAQVEPSPTEPAGLGVLGDLGVLGV
jgi:hypothetical protein